MYTGRITAREKKSEPNGSVNWNLSSNSFESTTCPLLFAAASVHRDESQPRLIESSQEKIFAGIAGNCRVVPHYRGSRLSRLKLLRQRGINTAILRPSLLVGPSTAMLLFHEAKSQDSRRCVASGNERVSSTGVVGNGRASRQSKPILCAFSTGNTLSTPLGPR